MMIKSAVYSNDYFLCNEYDNIIISIVNINVMKVITTGLIIFIIMILTNTNIKSSPGPRRQPFLVQARSIVQSLLSFP